MSTSEAWADLGGGDVVDLDARRRTRNQSYLPSVKRYGRHHARPEHVAACIAEAKAAIAAAKARKEGRRRGT